MHAARRSANRLFDARDDIGDKAWVKVAPCA
jgi:hypothetical protein